MSFTLLLTDVNSPLGKALEHELEREPFRLLMPAGNALDWSDDAAIAGYFAREQPDLVINCRGWEEAYYPGGQMPLVETARQLARACKQGSIPLIHFSSYSVFGADPKGTHSEKDAPAPKNETGAAFVEAEQAIAAELQRFIVLRLSWVIGAYGDNHLFETRSEAGGGFTVLIEIPFTRADVPEPVKAGLGASVPAAAIGGDNIIPLNAR